MAKSKTMTGFNGGGASAKYSPLGLFRAFTLAEVLITLGVIGVVAAMTLPAVIQSGREKATVTHLKKTYSLLQQAYKRAELELGIEPRGWGFGVDMNDANSHISMANRFVPYLKVLHNCVGKDNAYTKRYCIDNSQYIDSR